LKFKACKFVKIDAIGIEVAQQIKLSGCPTKDHFTAKNAFLPILAGKWPFVRQQFNFKNWILVELDEFFFWFFGF
jgi:hypothetical protein